MKQSRAAFSRRCRPLLGTFVEISLIGADPVQESAWIEDAFRAVERVERMMSFHDPRSELSRLNRARIGRWVYLSPETLEVLALARELQLASGGAYNAAVGGALVRWGLLPGRARAVRWEDLRVPGFEVGAGRARRISPVLVDLGGIAKGYAVDRAVKELRTRSANLSGCVNAGGDLRVFGPRPQVAYVRSARGDALRLKEEALATSTVVRLDGGSAYVNVRQGRALLKPRTVSVRAPHCAIADALTKVALLLPPRGAERLARAYGARILA